MSFLTKRERMEGGATNAPLPVLLLAYKMSGPSYEIVIIAGGVIFVIGIVIVIWKRHR